MVNTQFDRQSFLGLNAQSRLAQTVIGIIGLGGGGSHVVQQLAHVGCQRYVIYDDDVVEESNLNRLIGATVGDVASQSPKVLVAERMIRGLQPQASVAAVKAKWQEQPKDLHRCHIIIGCVDSLLARHELEVFCRRYGAAYIDIGMDVHGNNPPVIGGQVVLSVPGGPCLRCMGFLTDSNLSAEAAAYGAAGGRPQVVWPNGVLASTAVGLAIELVTSWTQKSAEGRYLVYDGNVGTVQPSLTVRNRSFGPCSHYSESSVGAPVFARL